MSRKQINPMTHGTLRIKVVDAAGAAVAGATVSARVYSPSGAVAASGLSMTNVGNGFYDLTVLPAWSTSAASEPIEGEFRVRITVTNGAVTLTRRIKYLVAFTEEA